MQSSNPDQLRRAKRIACWGGVGIVAIGLAVLIPMKWQGILPAKMTWLKVVLGPIFLTGLVPLALFMEGKREWLRFSLWMLLFIVVMLIDSSLN